MDKESNRTIKDEPTGNKKPEPNSGIESDRKGLTDLGNAERFVDQHKSVVRYCPETKKWYVWTQKRWQEDTGAEIDRKGFQTVKKIPDEAKAEDLLTKQKEEVMRHAKKSCSRGSIKSMLDLAKSFEELTVKHDDFDADPWLLNCTNGTLNLHTMELQSHNSADLITKIVNAKYIEDSNCPIWESFILDIMNNDTEMASYLQRLAGYWLTGDISEQKMIVFCGPGANGKTTFIEALRALLADYARHITTNSLLKSGSSPIRNDLARLQSARLVSAVEIGMGKALDEALIKQLTGGDRVTARFLYREYFEFNPQFKLIIAANHPPEIRGVDHGIWRRVILVPFNRTIIEDEIDADLPAKIRNELDGVLSWAVRGCREWLDRGLSIPESVKKATENYKEEMDIVGAFIKDRCKKEADLKVPVGDLYEVFKDWSDGYCTDLLGKKTFGKLMRQKGFNQPKSGSVRYWCGIALKETSEKTATGSADL